jgi:hypothetical protein
MRDAGKQFVDLGEIIVSSLEVILVYDKIMRRAVVVW